MADELQQLAPQQLWRRQVAQRLGGGGAVLSVSAVTGFSYLPVVGGVPTGTPTPVSGLSAICISSTDYRLYWFVGGAWRKAGP